MLYVTGLVSISLNNQMNKEWFIFKGTHHLGPFTLKEMEDLFRTGEINELSLVWKEGAEKWEALAKVAELNLGAKNEKTEVLAADLPPLPDLTEDDFPPPLSSKKMPAKTTNGRELPPPVPLDALLDPAGIKNIFKERRAPKTSPKIVFALIALVFVAVLFWFFKNEQNSLSQLRIKGVMPVYVDRLQEIASSQDSSFAMTMALSLDGKILYGSSNNDGEILTVIKLKSLPKRVLGAEEVELSVKGVMKDHLGEYRKMQLVKGKQFVPGEYSIEFLGRKIHFLNRTFKFLNDMPLFKKLNIDYSYQTAALIYAGTPREFEKKVLEYQSALSDEKMKPLNDKLERLQTLRSLLDKTMEGYLKVLEKIVKPKDMENFEKMYLQEVSPILQSLVLAANDLSKSGLDNKINDSQVDIAPYSEQVQIGKQIGELGSDMITEMTKLKSISKEEKKKFQGRFENRYTLIKIQIDSLIIKLQDQVSKLSH